MKILNRTEEWRGKSHIVDTYIYIYHPHAKASTLLCIYPSFYTSINAAYISGAFQGKLQTSVHFLPTPKYFSM